ncbi:uncharacterized protein ColSpa_01405 [Colletotrichum spaethianum]|uniref:Ricin B lectin domain-containing protein n=1 Tax=Colletotrichum spaethianum TaxID=700344 RepID=A0AA37P6Z4_9PEZI|nr:uncharacterized protein ColSpa_01405 [Colletotrichum spaethianum]GKT41224.1 hypothetical protein ColSpa_01405 [Colletotrichum spaethianum]
MSAVKLDSNAWYAISEGRVANVSDPLTSNLQDTNNGLRVFGKTDALWQFQPVGDKDGRYLVRLNSAGVGQQLSVCWSSAEVHPSGTRGCLRKTESDESQQWDITEWESEKGTLKFTNVANGTGYVLDVHPGSNLFMSSEIEGTDGVSARQPAQHWIMTSSKAVDDGAYSTIYSAGFIDNSRRHSDIIRIGIDICNRNCDRNGLRSSDTYCHRWLYYRELKP